MAGSDVRYALRFLIRQKLATTLVAGMLSLGIAATVAVFSLVNGLFLRPLPFPEPDRLVFVNETAPLWNLEMTGINFPDFVAWREGQQVFEAIGLLDPTAVNLADEASAERVLGARATYDMAAVLGLQPVLGRFFTPEEDRPGAPRVVMIGHGLWRERFGGEPDVIGRTLRINSEPHTIIGVLPPEAAFPDDVRLWVPLRGDPTAESNNYSHDGYGRLKPGVTVAQATADLRRAHQPIFDKRDQKQVVSPFARDLRAQFVSSFRTISGALAGAVALLLVVACANVASVMLARALARRREMSIRVAVGASRGRLVRQLFVENLVLAAMGGAAGAVLGQFAVQTLVQALPDTLPSWMTVAVDARVVGMAVAVSAGAAVLFGWAPALHASQADLRTAMSGVASDAVGAPRGRRTLRLLVAAEFALAAVLLVSGGLLFRAFDRVRDVDPGFRPERQAVFSVSLPSTAYPNREARNAFWDRLTTRLQALPDVEAVGLVTCAPMSGCHWGRFLEAEGQPPRAEHEANPVVLFRAADPGYRASMGLTLLGGRWLEPADGTPEQPTVAVINETFARTFFPGVADPVGRRIRFTGSTERPWMTVVGLVADVRHYGLERDMRPGVYTADDILGPSSTMVSVRTRGEPSPVLGAARAVLRELDPEVPIARARTMEEAVAASVRVRAVYSWTLAVFAGLALVLALGGAYGVTSYLVSQRTREIGIRMALGARRADISRAVIGSSLAGIALGIALGVGAAVGVSRFFAALLFGVPGHDALILTVAVALLGGTAVAATLAPARRAARVDPVVSLRVE